MQASQIIIIILLVANLLATVWFGMNEKPAPVTSEVEKAAEHELPAVVSSDVRVQLYNDFAKAFNAKDYDALYDMFGETAKMQFTKESAQTEFEKLAKFFHAVEGGGFTHSEFAGRQGNTNIYILYYTVRFSEKSEFGTVGSLKITLAVSGNEYQVYGIRLDGG